MAILKMKKLRLAAVRSEKEELLRRLMLLGCVEVTELTERDGEHDLAHEQSALIDLKSNYSSLIRALELLDRYAPVKKGLFSVKPEMDTEKFLTDEGVSDAAELAESIISADDRVRRIGAEESRLRSTIESLRPWTGAGLPLDLTGTERTAVMTGTLPASLSLGDAEALLRDVTGEAEIFPISDDKMNHYIAAVCMKEEQGDVLEVLREMGFIASPVSGIAGTAEENISAYEAELVSLAAEKTDSAGRIIASAGRRGEIELASERVKTRIERAAAEEKLLGSEKSVFLQGWVPEESEKELSAVLSEFDCAWETEAPSKDEYPQVPVKLKNNKFTNSLNMVTNMYSLPAYGTVDPNPLMAPFFILFFGLMMADMGYGILMVIAALVAMKKIKPRGGSLVFTQLLLYCGIATFLMGLLTGGFFSDIPYQLVHIFNPNSTWRGLWSLFSPETDSETVLYGSMVLGVLHLNAGMAVNFIQKAKSGDLASGIFEEGSLWVILAGGILAVLKVGSVAGIPVVLVIGVLMLLFGAGRGKKGFGKITAAFGCIYNTATGWFGDVLSYSRIMALMLAGGVIGKVFNTVALMPMKNGGINVVSVIVFIIIFLIGHAMNFGLNLLGCFVHDLRLQCLEFFGKFYADGGRPFSPLKVDGKYIRTKEN